jgi:hypothetical protein
MNPIYRLVFGVHISRALGLRALRRQARGVATADSTALAAIRPGLRLHVSRNAFPYNLGYWFVATVVIPDCRFSAVCICRVEARRRGGDVAMVGSLARRHKPMWRIHVLSLISPTPAMVSRKEMTNAE